METLSNLSVSGPGGRVIPNKCTQPQPAPVIHFKCMDNKLFACIINDTMFLHFPNPKDARNGEVSKIAEREKNPDGFDIMMKCRTITRKEYEDTFFNSNDTEMLVYRLYYNVRIKRVLSEA